jgi:DNA-binding winged helix-turn-helix (wHTH) protein
MKLRIGDCLLDAEARRLTRDDHDVHLSPKAFDLLVLLVARRPAVVDKAEIRQHLWPGVHVVDANLSNLVNEIRGVVGRDFRPAAIRTVHGVGYAFAGEASDVTEPPARTPFFVVVNDRPIPLRPGENVIGRDASCPVWVDVSGVSRRHACICVSGGNASGATLEDLNSTNGTYVHDRPVTGPVRLEDGDRIGIGPATLVFRRQHDVDVPTKRVRRRSRT